MPSTAASSQNEARAVIGFNDPMPTDSSFCTLSAGRLRHYELERYSRNKYEFANPVLGFVELFPDELRRYGHIAVEEAESLAPAIRRLIASGRDGIDSFLSDLKRSQAEAIMGPGYEAIEAFRPDRAAIVEFADHLLSGNTNIQYWGHHECHAANAHFSSGEQESLAITLDGGGYDVIEGVLREVHGSVWRFSGADRSVVSYETELSVGMAWSRCVRITGLRWGEEGTLMAMAALGDPRRFQAKIAEPRLWLTSGAASEAADAVQGYLASLRSMMVADQDRYDLAAALQSETEIRVRDYLARFLTGYSGCVTLAGGVFLNCLVTGKIGTWFPEIRRTYIPPAPYDGGICIGAAQLTASQLSSDATRFAGEMMPFESSHSYTHLSIVQAARSRGIPLDTANESDATKLLGEGAIVGIFQGGSESGRRALGSRSLLADPRNLALKERLNTLIKHRKWFRPFAPMVLAEHVQEWFDVPEGFESPYMSFAVSAHSHLRGRIPAVLHVDGTARVQTVHRSLTPRLHGLLSAWYAQTRVPILLNTSFNDGEPIVETPDHALETFRRVPIDALYFADHGLLALRTNGPNSALRG